MESMLICSYRRAPEHTFPIPYEDCLRATKYVMRHAETYGIDRNKIGVKGNINANVDEVRYFSCSTCTSEIFVYLLSYLYKNNSSELER